MNVAGLTGDPFVCLEKAKMRFFPSGGGKAVVFTNIHISDHFPATFISESLLAKAGCCIMKKDKMGAVYDKNGKLLFSLALRGGLYLAEGEFTQPKNDLMPTSGTSSAAPDLRGAFDALLKASEKEVPPLLANAVLLAKSYTRREVVDQLSRMHRRLSHMDFRKVAKTFGVVLPSDYTFPLCDACLVGKAADHPHHEGAKVRATRTAQGFHVDFVGPLPTVSITGDRYMLLFIDDFTEMLFDFYVTKQSQYYDIFVALIARFENEHGRGCVCWIRSDGGLVFSEKRVVDFCVKKGIACHYSAAHSQWQNGKSERSNRTIIELSSAGLHQSGLSPKFAPFALRLAVTSTNRVPANPAKNTAKGFPKDFSRFERWLNRAVPSQLNGIYPLGILAYKKIPDALRQKFQPKAEPCLYLGLHPTIKGAMLLPLKHASRITVSAVFTTNEGYFPLKLDTFATASSTFVKEYGNVDQTSLPIYYPSIAVEPDPILQDPRVDPVVSVGAPGIVPSVPATSVSVRRSLRDTAPSAIALQNIVDQADSDERRNLANAQEGAFSFLISPFGLRSVEEEDEVEENPNFSFSHKRRLAGKVPPSTGVFDGELVFLEKVLVVLPNQRPSTRQEFQDATPSTTRRADLGEHCSFWSWARKREVTSHLKNKTLGPLLAFPPAGFKTLPTSFNYMSAMRRFSRKTSPNSIGRPGWW